MLILSNAGVFNEDILTIFCYFRRTESPLIKNPSKITGKYKIKQNGLKVPLYKLLK